MFRVSGLMKTLTFRNAVKPTVKYNTLLIKPMRLMATDAQNYFKRVLNQDTPPTFQKYDFERDIRETQDYKAFHMKKRLSLIHQNKHKKLEKLNDMRDYELEDYHLEGATQPDIDYKAMIKGLIPEDQIVKSRAELEVCGNLIPALQAAVFNLPYDVTKREIKDIYQVYGTIDQVQIFNDVVGVPSYAIITYKSHNSLQECVSQSSGTWLRDKLLKVRSSEHARQEKIEHRTVVLGNLPKWANEKHITSLVGNDYSIMKIDMPLSDIRIEEARRFKHNPENEQQVQQSFDERMRKIQKLYDIGVLPSDQAVHQQQTSKSEGVISEEEKKSSSLAEKMMEYEKDLYKTTVFNQSVKAQANLQVLNKEKRLKVITLCSMVYNENMQVNDSIKNLKAERDGLVARLNNVMEYPEVPQKKENESYILPEQVKALQSYISYVQKNHDSLPPELLSEIQQNRLFEVIMNYSVENAPSTNGKKSLNFDKIANEISLQISSSNMDSLRELASGYEWLLESLERREKILKHRLERLLKDYGKNDRILYDKKDFRNELEDVEWEQLDHYQQAPLLMEDIISISEQMRNIVRFKEPGMAIEERTRNELPGEWDSPNFTTHDIQRAKLTERTSHMTPTRQLVEDEFMDVTKIKNSNVLLNEYNLKALLGFHNKTAIARDRFDIPFDELYHKEKSLVDNVVKATKELQEAEKESERHLMKHTGSVEDIFDPNLKGINQTQDDVRALLKGQSNKNNPHKIGSSSNDDTADSLFINDAKPKHSYIQTLEQAINNLSKGYMDKVNSMIDKIANIQNLGYCFVTFSNADDARKVILSEKSLVIETTPLDVFLKNEMTHHDFNAGYLQARTKLDSQLLYKRRDLEEAKAKLKAHEESFETNMPKSARFKAMKDAAKSAIEENQFINREGMPFSKYDNERISARIKELERQTASDLTPLYDTSQKEQERRIRHRKAFDTYKSYAFLKSGLQKTNLEKKLTGDSVSPASSTESFKFPSPDKIAKVFVNDTNTYTMLQAEEKSYKPGRKFEYTPQDFIESYFGKDLERRHHVSLSHREIYGFNDEMKRMYPFEKSTGTGILEKLQRHATEKIQARDVVTEKETHPEVLEYEKLMKSKLDSGEAQPDWSTEKDDHVFLEGSQKERMEKLERMSQESPLTGKPKWGRKRQALAIKDEFLDFKTENQFKSRYRKHKGYYEDHEKEAMLLKQKEGSTAAEEGTVEEKAQEEPESTGKVLQDPNGPNSEKWAPADESEDEDVQKIREKVYSEYLDTVKVKALKEGNNNQFNIAEADFMKNYEEVALKPNAQASSKTKKLEPFKLNKNQEAMLDKFQDLSQNEEYRKKILEYDIKLMTKEKESEVETPKNTKNLYEHMTKERPLQAQKEQGKIDKSDTRVENEKFLYRNEFSKDDQEKRELQDHELSTEFRVMRLVAKNEKSLKKDIDDTIDNINFTNKKSGQEFLKRFERGQLVTGLEQRDKDIQENDYQKDLSEIAHGQDPTKQNLYKAYMEHKLPEEQDTLEDEIKDREAKFFEAAKLAHKKRTPSQARTFQEYEDYKRLQAEREMDQDTYPLEEPELENKMSKRDWLAKIWSGTITNDEFENYMMDISQKQDKRGEMQTVATPKEYPHDGPEKFITNEDRTRLFQESLEEKRRFAVLNGQVSEQDSYRYIDDYVKECDKHQKILNSKTFNELRGDVYEIDFAITQGEQVREYYFDPNQGVTLRDHINSVKKLNPNAQVESYVDKDGFTVIKKKIEKQYKYNLDRLLSKTPQEMEVHLNDRIKETVSKYTDNVRDEEHFIELMQTFEENNEDLIKDIKIMAKLNQGAIDEPELFKQEIYEQIRMKAYRHKYFKKLSEQDFVKFKQPETVVMERLQKIHSKNIMDNERLLDESNKNNDYLSSLKSKNKKRYDELVDDPDFVTLSKEEYSELRKTIKERKEAKAKLLKQGYPTLKNYVYL